MERTVTEYPMAHEALTKALSRKEPSTVVFCVGDDNDLFFEARIESGRIAEWSAYDAAGAEKEITFRRVEERPERLKRTTKGAVPLDGPVVIVCYVCVVDKDGGGGRTCMVIPCPQ
jgi:hypothetical protein